MIFMTWFSKTKVLNIFSLFLFLIYLLPIVINEKVYTTFLAFEEGSNIFWGQLLLYGFHSVISQVLIEFFFVCVFFCNLIKKEANVIVKILDKHIAIKWFSSLSK